MFARDRQRRARGVAPGFRIRLDGQFIEQGKKLRCLGGGFPFCAFGSEQHVAYFQPPVLSHERLPIPRKLIQQSVRPRGCLVLKKPSHRDGTVQHEIHRRPAFFSASISFTVSRGALARRTRISRTACRASSRLGRLAGTSLAIASACRVMVISSPRATRSINSESLFLASASPTVGFGSFIINRR